MDYKNIFEQSPFDVLIFEPKEPYTVLNATNSYFPSIGRPRESIVGKPLDEAFPNGPNGWNAEAKKTLTDSFEDVLRFKRKSRMPTVRYDVVKEDGGTEVTYWSPENYPIFDDEGNLEYIFHVAINVTRFMSMVR